MISPLSSGILRGPVPYEDSSVKCVVAMERSTIG